MLSVNLGSVIKLFKEVILIKVRKTKAMTVSKVSDAFGELLCFDSFLFHFFISATIIKVFLWIGAKCIITVIINSFEEWLTEFRVLVEIKLVLCQPYITHWLELSDSKLVILKEKGYSKINSLLFKQVKAFDLAYKLEHLHLALKCLLKDDHLDW